MLGIDELAVCLFTHFNSIDRIFLSVQVSNLRCSVGWCVVEHRHGQEQWQSIGKTAPENQVKARLLSIFITINFAVPGIGRRNIDRRLLAVISTVTHYIVKLITFIDRAYVDFPNGKAQTVADVPRLKSRSGTLQTKTNVSDRQRIV